MGALELSVVHELTDRGPRGRGNLDQIEVSLLGEPESLVDGDDPDLLALRTTPFCVAGVCGWLWR
jgi:hypothetical protein